MAQTFRLYRIDGNAQFNFLTGDLRHEHGTFIPPAAKEQTITSTKFRVVNKQGATGAEIRAAAESIALHLANARRWDEDSRIHEDHGWVLEWATNDSTVLRYTVLDGSISFYGDHSMSAFLEDANAKFEIDLTLTAPAEDQNTIIIRTGDTAQQMGVAEFVYATATHTGEQNNLTGNINGRIFETSWDPVSGQVPSNDFETIWIGLRDLRGVVGNEDTYQATLAPADFSILDNGSDPDLVTSVASSYNDGTLTYNTAVGDFSGTNNDDGEWRPLLATSVDKIVTNYPTVNTNTMDHTNYVGRFRVLASIYVLTGHTLSFRALHGSQRSVLTTTPMDDLIPGPSVTIEGDSKMHLYDLGEITWPPFPIKQLPDTSYDGEYNNWSMLAFQGQYGTGTAATSNTFRFGYIYLLPIDAELKLTRTKLGITGVDKDAMIVTVAANGDTVGWRLWKDLYLQASAAPEITNWRMPINTGVIVWVGAQGPDDHFEPSLAATQLQAEVKLRSYAAWSLYD